MKFTLRQLEVFCATASTGSVSRAAGRMAMSQSAASAALQDLEQRYDTLLFDRIGKRLRLNGQGRALLPVATALLDQAAELEQRLQQSEVAGELAIGATLTIGNHVAVPILTRFRSAHPGLRASLHVANTVTIARQVLNFELDVGLIEGEYTHAELQLTRWRDDELTVFCAPGHPYAKRASLDDEQLAAAQWILRERGSGTRQTFDKAMSGLRDRLDIYFELEHSEAIKQAVLSSQGIGCLSRLALQEDIESGRLVALATPGRDMRRSFYFIVHAQKYRSAALELWLEFCRRSAR